MTNIPVMFTSAEGRLIGHLLLMDRKGGRPVEQRFKRRVPARKRRGSLTVIAIPSSGEPPKSVGIPMRILGICLATVIGLAGILLASYFHMSRGVAVLNDAKTSSETALEQALVENQTLRLEKQERLAQIEELADKAKMLEAAVNQIANEKAEIWAIVKGTGTAEKSASSSTSVSSRGDASRGGSARAERELPGSISGVEADGLTIGAGIDIFEEERRLAEATAEELESLLRTSESVQKGLSDLRASAESYRYKLDHTPSGWPVSGRITSSYGNRRHPILRVYRFHQGVDIGAPYGTPIRATADGVVVKSGWSGGYGNVVEISHGFNCNTFYAHNSRNVVKAGQKVKKGQVIAYVGSTGVSTGSHCHYEVRIQGRHVDPAPYMK
jgi:murein DD-endopeptidase MepM/ murein hydrolase activator NlpD